MDIAIIEHNSNLYEIDYYDNFIYSVQTMIVISQPQTEKVLAFEILTNMYRSKGTSYMVIELTNFQQQFPILTHDSGAFLRIAAGGNDGTFDTPEYLVISHQYFSKFIVFKFCSFLQHLKNGSCVLNPPGSLHFLYQSKSSYNYGWTCDDVSLLCRADEDAIECIKAQFICEEEMTKFTTEEIVAGSIGLFVFIVFLHVMGFLCLKYLRRQQIRARHQMFIYMARRHDLEDERAKSLEDNVLATKQKIVKHLESQL